MAETIRRGTEVVSQYCARWRSARMGSGPHSVGSFNGEGVESSTVAEVSGGSNRRRPSRSVKALHERNANLGYTADAEKLVNKGLRRSPRFETPTANCGLLDKIQIRRSPRLIAAVSREENKENEGYTVHGDRLVHPNVVKLKEGRVRKRKAKVNRNGTSQPAHKKSPSSVPHNESRRSNSEIYDSTQKRRSPRFIHGASDEEKKENERNVVHGCGLVQNVGKEKEERKKVAKGICDGIVQNARRKAPKFASLDGIQRPNCRTSGSTPKIRSPIFVDAISDEDRKENEGNVMVMRANVREDVKKRTREATGSRIQSFANKEAEGVTANVKKMNENNETKNSNGQTAAGERTENTDIVSEKFMRSGGRSGRKRNVSSDLLKDEGRENKRFREENGSHKKKACVESEVKHGYHDDPLKRKSGTLLGSSGFLGWSQDQENALERAYLMTRPSPHFWREIAKLVPGKSAKECFDRIHSIIPTPPTQQPRSRTKRKVSPLGQISLAGNVPLEQFSLRGRISGKRKSLLARRAVRHILRKQVLADQGRAAGLFSAFEGSCSTDKDPSQMRKLTIKNNKLKSCLEMNGESEPSGSRNKMPNTVTPFHQQALVSPEILKKVKNLDLHEKYIDRLHIREQTRSRKAAVKRTDSVPAETKGRTLDKTETLKYARLALVSDARDALKQIQQESHEIETFSEYDGFNDDDNDNDDCESDLGTC
ncbi:uncharacterized protein LOC116266624 [Nymphaea colorata]|nr:uncharacterized protein LOC116266624 [Nymphaea colorata]